MTLDRDLHQLTVIGSLRPGLRLGHDLDGTLFVAKPGFLGTAWRIILGESRSRTCDTIRQALVATEERLADLQHIFRLTGPVGSADEELTQRAAMLLQALTAAQGGVDSLRQTYAGDLSAQASLDLLAQRCSSVVKKAMAVGK